MLIKVAWLSSYPPRRCGLANYSFEYLQALRRLANVEVISHVKNGRDGTYSIVNLEDPQWWKRVDELIAKISPDVVHIQHAFDLWGIRDDNMPLLELIRSLKHRALPIVITYHNPFDNLSGVKRRFAVESLKLIDVCVLHCEYQIATLPVKPKQVKIIPHGSKEGIKLAKEACREALGLSNWKYVVGTAGLYSRRKSLRG
jgi:glycosyltransferase involved in cell wall biosynthesis